MKCHQGSCDVVFYFDPGTTHAVICEMYSTGTEQQKLCLQDHQKGSAKSVRNGLFIALGSIVLTLAIRSPMLNFD